MARPVADYLIEIGASIDQAPVVFAASDPDLAPIWPDEPKEDPQVAIDAAREEGRAAALAAAREEYEAKLTRMRENFDSKLVSSRQTWAREEGEVLRNEIATTLIAIEERLADSVARVLRPFILRSIRERMMAKLVDNIRTIVGSADKMAIKIAGPADLLDALRQELGTAPTAIDYELRNGLDVSVVADQTSIDTQLKAWTGLIGAEG
jgi:hypothetical protein